MCCRMGCIFERQNTCIHGQMSVTMLIQCTGCDTCINCMYDQADQSPALKLPNFTNCSLQLIAGESKSTDNGCPALKAVWMQHTFHTDRLLVNVQHLG